MRSAQAVLMMPWGILHQRQRQCFAIENIIAQTATARRMISPVPYADVRLFSAGAADIAMFRRVRVAGGRAIKPSLYVKSITSGHPLKTGDITALEARDGEGVSSKEPAGDKRADRKGYERCEGDPQPCILHDHSLSL